MSHSARPAAPFADHALAGLGAGVVAVKFQVANKNPTGGVGTAIWNSLKDIKDTQGWRGLYRGVGPNIAGNASSWGLYFLFYNMLKARAAGGAVTAIMTNPIWVVKVRMFTTRPEDPTAYRSLWHGFSSIYRSEGIKGLYRGTTLALFGVSNEMKQWGFQRKRRRFASEGKEWTPADDKLSNTSYTLMSGASKLFALSMTYPYQVVRSRIQNNATTHLYPTIPACIKRTWAEEGTRGFYRGLGTNLDER
ncbi:mitochondrial carrier domain-containing protein [Irpex lacteus]|nr:mitochondrial carrier domain-containing protein [Irpex lacteus]